MSHSIPEDKARRHWQRLGCAFVLVLFMIGAVIVYDAVTPDETPPFSPPASLGPTPTRPPLPSFPPTATPSPSVTRTAPPDSSSTLTASPEETPTPTTSPRPTRAVPR